MVVGVEATRLVREVRGIGRYVRALLPRLVSLRTDVHLILFVKDAHEVSVMSEFIAQHRVLRGRATAADVSGLTSAAADVFWYPWNIADPVPDTGPVVVTMHDVVPVALPDPRWLAWRKNTRWRKRYLATAERATMVIADSRFTAEEVRRVLDVPADRIRVILLAADDMEPPAGDDQAVLRRLRVKQPYVLTVGAADRRKNHAVLVRAMQRVVATDANVTLVFAGPRRHVEEPLPPDARWMRTLGFVSDSDLASLYRASAAMVMPSFYEGFGLPVLEAMRLGAPVICARASSLPEVAGDAGAWFDPHSDVELAASIQRVLGDESLRANMSTAGLARAAEFSWSDTARQTLEVFDEARARAGTSSNGHGALGRSLEMAGRHPAMK